jgi:hypothetical protein
MRRANWLAFVVGGFLAVGAAVSAPRGGLFTAAAWSQNVGQRTVSGTVLDADSKPALNATVFLKNQKTKAIRSFSTTADGHYHFAQIDMSVDYDLWAEKDGKKSATKTVSSWDARKEFVTELKLK